MSKSASSVGSYLQMMSIYPLLSNEEMQKLFESYQYGSNEAKEKLFNSNWRLVVSIAKRIANTNHLNHLDLMDLIQDGNLGLIRAIETYDQEKGAFSTYATTVIEREIYRQIDDTDDEIRRPYYLKELASKYYYLVNKSSSEGKTLSNEEICDILDISENVLQKLNYSMQLGTISLSSPVGELGDDNDSSLDNFIPDDKDDYSAFINAFDDNRLFSILKFLLSPIEYYVLYNRVLTDKRISLEKLAATLSVTCERIRQVELRALKKIKPYMQNEILTLQAYSKINNKLNNNKSLKVNINPVTPDEIIQYAFLKNILSEEELSLLKILYFGKIKYPNNLLAEKFNMSEDEFDNFYKLLCSKIGAITNSKHYYNFKQKVLERYKTSIYKKNFECSVETINYDDLSQKYLSLSYNEIIDLFNRANIYITSSMQSILRKTFMYHHKTDETNYDLERDLNILLLGYDQKDTFLSPEVLYPIYLKHKDEFKEEEQKYLECYFFNLGQTTDIEMKRANYVALVNKLEKMYYHMNTNSFDKEKYLIVRERHAEKLGESRIKLLDLYYGINTPKYSLEDLAKYYNVNYDYIHNQIYKAIDKAKNLFIENTRNIEIDKKVYIPFLINNICNLTPLTLNILTYFLINGFDYTQISRLINLSNYQISNIITGAIRKMDSYRFGIIDCSFDVSKFKQFLNANQSKYDTIQLKALTMKFINNEESNEIANALKVDVNVLTRFFQKVKQQFLVYQIDGVTISEEEILKEYRNHPSESVLTIRERELVKLLYIDKLSYERICKIYNYEISNLYHLYYTIHNKIKARKIGILKPDLLYFSRNELEIILKDPNLPISDKDRNIICYLFELEGYPFKSIDEISIILSYSKSNIRRSYYRSIINIKKYQNNEISKKISFEHDIKPILKFFDKFSQNIIVDYYQNNYTYQLLSQKYDLSYDVVDEIMNDINYKIYCLANNIDISAFDFEYYQTVCNNDDIPFYGNKELAKKIFNLYYGVDNGKCMTITQIAKEIEFDGSPSTLSYILSNYILSIYKYRDGIRKEKCFSNEDIVGYYNSHKDEFSARHKAYYQRYLERGNDYYVGIKSYINKNIIFDLIKEKDPNYIRLADLSKEDIEKILEKYADILDETVKAKLKELYSFEETSQMTDNDLRELFKILNTLDLKLLTINANTLDVSKSISLSRTQNVLK